MVFQFSASQDYWSDFDAIKTPPREATLARTAQDIQAQAGSHRANGGGKTNGGGVDLWASVSWATKGATLNNVFAANGTPLTTGAGALMGTTYLTGITVLRGF